MSDPSPHALAIPVDAADDPLYDAVAIAFVYAAWAVAGMWLGDRAGLLVLVLATTVLTVTALAGRSRTMVVQGARPFLVEFATIILYCATALAISVLAIDTFT
ncbi:MAG: hypothetical protein ACE367_05900 [Acidimicrobiales bacterium]